VPFYPAADRDVHPAPARAEVVACRCCPGGVSRSTRARYYPSDMSTAEWAVCEPLLPAPAWLAGRGGRPASHCMRDIVDAIRYLTRNGPVWRAGADGTGTCEHTSEGRRHFRGGEAAFPPRPEGRGIHAAILMTRSAVLVRHRAPAGLPGRGCGGVVRGGHGCCATRAAPGGAGPGPAPHAPGASRRPCLPRQPRPLAGTMSQRAGPSRPAATSCRPDLSRPPPHSATGDRAHVTRHGTR